MTMEHNMSEAKKLRNLIEIINEADYHNAEEEDRTVYFNYLDDLRESGVTNMFGAGTYIQREFGVDKREAKRIVMAWMESFGQRNESINENNESHASERHDRELQSISDNIQRVAQELKNAGMKVDPHMWKMVKYFAGGVEGVTKDDYQDAEKMNWGRYYKDDDNNDENEMTHRKGEQSYRDADKLGSTDDEDLLAIPKFLKRDA